MNSSLPSRCVLSLALYALLSSGCYLSRRIPEAIGRDAGSVDAATIDAGPLPSCDELFRRTPDIVNEFPYVDFTCTETTFPLATSHLEVFGPGAARIVRSCVVVTSAYATSGWNVGDAVSGDGPGVRIRVAGPSPDFASERVLWDGRAIDTAGRVIAARAESLRIDRATPAAFGAHVEALASIVPSLWASPGQVNAGLYGHPASNGSSLRRATLGATWLENAPGGSTFEWVYPDEQVHELALPGVPSHALVVEWMEGSNEQWRLLDGERMAAVTASETVGAEPALVGISVLRTAGLGDAAAYADGQVLVLQGGTVLAFSASDGSPLGTFAMGVRALLPNAVLFDDGRLEPLGAAGEAVVFAPEDVTALGRVLGYVGEGLLVGHPGVAGSTELPGPHFARFEALGIDANIRTASVRTGAFADVLYTGADMADRAQRLALSFRGCD